MCNKLILSFALLPTLFLLHYNDTEQPELMKTMQSWPTSYTITQMQSASYSHARIKGRPRNITNLQLSIEGVCTTFLITYMRHILDCEDPLSPWLNAKHLLPRPQS